MQNNINILNELKELGSDVLLSMEHKNVYSVPPDYFNNFSQNLLSRIFVESIPRVNPYTVPVGYFNNLSEIIFEKVSLRKNIQEFDGLEKLPYSIPDGYFDNLAENILQKIKDGTNQTVQQELEEIAPLLSKLPKINVYSVPEDYFIKLNPLKREREKPAAKVVSIRRMTPKWFNYAAAACVAIALFGGAYLYFSSSEVSNPSNEPATAIAVQQGLSQLTDSEIANYLNQDNSTAIYTSQGSDEQKDLDIKTLLENMSDEEIEQYLNNNTEPGEKKGGI